MSGYRRPSGRQKRRNIQIVITEGLSEGIYLERIRARYGDIPVHTVNASGGDVKNLKRECLKLIREKDEGDIIAIVADVDEKTADEISEFENWCKHNSVELYISNPSFEVFLLMHFGDAKAWMTQGDLEDALSSSLGRKYCKARGIPMDDSSVMAAIDRAELSLTKGMDPIESVSKNKGSTNFHLLLFKIAGRLRRRKHPFRRIRIGTSAPG